MKRILTRALLATAMALATSWSVSAQEKREIHIVNDNGADYIVQKVYELKHVDAASIYPYVKNALKQSGDDVGLTELNYKAEKRQLLLVALPPYLIPFIDDLIAKLDRPCAAGSAVNGTFIGGDGIYDYAYNPKNRSSNALVRTVTLLAGSGEGKAFVDGFTNSIYWKDSLSDGSDYFKFLDNLDVPVPQVELSVNLYELSDSKLRELGIDWIAWKNGPGASFFQVAGDMMNYQSNSDKFGGMSNIASQASNAWGGFIFAPQIDASYLRLLAEKGRSRTWTSGFITVMNNIAPEYANDNTFGDAAGANFAYHMSVNSGDQYIQKDDNMETVVKTNPVSVDLTVTQPVINIPGKDAAGKDLPAILNCNYTISANSTVSVENNTSTLPVTNAHIINSNLYMICGSEKLVASFSKEWKTKQKQGLPWISELPILEYIAGSVNEAQGVSRFFVTCNARPMNPSSPVNPRDSDTMETFHDMIMQDAH